MLADAQRVERVASKDAERAAKRACAERQASERARSAWRLQSRRACASFLRGGAEVQATASILSRQLSSRVAAPATRSGQQRQEERVQTAKRSKFP